MRKHLGEYFISFGIWGYLALLLSILGGINTYFNITGNPISIFAIVPTWGWLTLLILGLVIMPFLAFHKIRTRLDSYENVQPHIVFDQTRESPLYVTRHNIEGIIIGKDAIYHIVQAWFVNSPKIRSEKAIGQEVTAKIEFYDKGAPSPRFLVYGQWAVSTAPNHVGQEDITSKVDMLPNDEPQKLNVALKWAGDEECYAYSKENVMGYDDGCNPNNMLLPGEYSVCVKLKGVRVDQDFNFTLVNPGVGADLELKVIP